MIVTLQTQGLHTLEQVHAFLAGNTPISFTLTGRSAAHTWMTDTLRRFCYKEASRDERGVLRHFLAKVTGLSRAQVDELPFALNYRAQSEPSPPRSSTCQHPVYPG